MITEIEELLEAKDYRGLRGILAEMPPPDIALLFEELPAENFPLLFRILPKELAAECFVELDPEVQETLINSFSDNELTEVFENLFLDDTVDIIEEMPANVVKRIIATSPSDVRQQINRILRYPKNSAGTIMTTEFVELKETMTEEDVFKNIRRSGVDKETIYDCYVTDARRHLIGVLSVKTLLTTDIEDAVVGDLMEEDVISANVYDDREDVAKQIKKYGFMALPVVDRENRLVGIVTYDDAMDVIEEESTEDIEKMAAITPTDKPYLRTGVFETFRARIPWLIILMLTSIVTSEILQYFEDALAANALLMAFVPMLMNTGGNAGGQVSVSIIRALSLDEVRMRDIFRIIWKELRVALICGVTLAVVNFAKMLVIDRVSVSIALVVSLTVLILVPVAKIVGGVLPMGAKRIGLDPAIMASPFITTVVDALALLLYFRVASVFIGL
ncbi:MAG: magnesium transporter [Ruminococcaceae bacterium]|nr:magnesium transporter [Oscillospiraceae bacterium]